MPTPSETGQARFVRIYGTRARTEREGFQIITRMPPPPTDDPNDPEPYEGWLTLVHDEIERRKPKGWTVEKWDVDVDWMSHVD